MNVSVYVYIISYLYFCYRFYVKTFLVVYPPWHVEDNSLCHLLKIGISHNSVKDANTYFSFKFESGESSRPQGRINKTLHESLRTHEPSGNMSVNDEHTRPFGTSVEDGCKEIRNNNRHAEDSLDGDANANEIQRGDGGTTLETTETLSSVVSHTEKQVKMIIQGHRFPMWWPRISWVWDAGKSGTRGWRREQYS